MQQDGTTPQDGTHKGGDNAPTPEPLAEQDAAPGRREIRMEADERTPEEAGYGYGV